MTQNLVPDDDNIIKEFINSMRSSLLHALLIRGLIQPDELNDPQKVKQAIESNRAIFRELNWIYLLHEKFVNSAKEAFEKKDVEVGVVLLATAVEQIVNSFYRMMLETKGIMTEAEITEIIRNNNIAPKLSWLLTLVSESEYELDSNFKREILRLMELRNQIVHYKAVPLSVPDLDKDDITYIKGLDSVNLDELVSIPDDLFEFLDEILNDMIEKHSPEYVKAKKTIENITQGQRNAPS